MITSSLLTYIDSLTEIQSHFDWHRQQGQPLLLMCAVSEGPLPAMVRGFDAAHANVHVRCVEMPSLDDDCNVAYAVIGQSPSGANFLASGRMTTLAGTTDCFALSLPVWIDVSQSRDNYRCPAPFGHFLHFSATDPHLNDVVCRVHNISLGGLAVEWEHDQPPELCSVTDTAILKARHIKVQLGKMRVAHIRALAQGCIIGLYFEQDVPRSFNALVLDVQRTEHRSLTEQHSK